MISSMTFSKTSFEDFCEVGSLSALPPIAYTATLVCRLKSAVDCETTNFGRTMNASMLSKIVLATMPYMPLKYNRRLEVAVELILMAKDLWISDLQSGDMVEQEISIQGWVKRSRSSGKIIFMSLRDSTGSIQCVAKKDTLDEQKFADLKSALIESSLVITGTVKEDQRSGGNEISVTDVEIIGAVNPEAPFPITESAMAAADGGEDLMSEFVVLLVVDVDSEPD